MKTLINTLLAAAIILTASTKSIAGNNKKADSATSTVCLQILGIAMDANHMPINGVEVKLYKQNEEQEWTEITNVQYHDHNFMFSLNSNEYYTIEISKPGYVTRSVGISTAMPANISLNEMFKYEFEVEMFQAKKVADDFYLDFPVALISYDKKRDVFDNNYAYTTHIKTKIKETAGSEAYTTPETVKY